MSYSLLQQINEVGFLDKLKKGISNFGQTDQAADTESSEPEERTRPTIEDDSDALVTLAGELMSVPPAESRMIVFLDHALLKSTYLIPGGGGKLIDQLNDDEISEIVSDEAKTLASDGKGRVVEMIPEFLYHSMLTPPQKFSRADRAVMINVPKSLVSELRSTGSDVEKSKAILKKIMSHKLYVMTLNLPKANQKSIVAKMGTARNTDEMGKAFDPSIIENYPLKSRLVNAKSEWDALKASSKRPSKDDRREAQVSDKEKQANWASRERAADATVAGPAKDENKELLTIISRSSDAYTSAQTMQGYAAKKGLSKEEMIDKLTGLKELHPLVNFDAVIDKYRKMKQ